MANKKSYGNCEYCGGPIYNKQRKRFCCVECLREFQKKQKESCPDCGVKLTTENTYVRGYSSEGKPWLDNYCKSCRMKRNRASYLKRRAENVGEYIAPKQGRQTNAAREKICGNDEPTGNQRNAWIRKMQRFPVIFTRTFHKPATIENIQSEAEIWM